MITTEKVCEILLGFRLQTVLIMEQVSCYVLVIKWEKCIFSVSGTGILENKNKNKNRLSPVTIFVHKRFF